MVPLHQTKWPPELKIEFLRQYLIHWTRFKNYNSADPGELLHVLQGSHRLEKYLNFEGFLEKSMKIKSALKRTGKLLKSLEKSLNSTIFCRT